MNYKYPLIPHLDYQHPSSPSMRQLVENILQKHDPSEPTGFAHLFHIVTHSDMRSQIRLKPNTRKGNQEPALDVNHPPIVEHQSNIYSSKEEIHPIVGEIAKTKLINHGEQMTNPMDLFTHIGKVASALKDYRPLWTHKIEHGHHLPQKNRVIYNRIPKKEQEMIANQFKRAISHPDFQQHLEEYGNRLSADIARRDSYSSDKPSIQSKYEHTKHLFNSVLTDPHVRDSMHDFLDSFENLSPVHHHVAATIRSHMTHGKMAAPEIVRIAHKFANNPNSIDFGSHGAIYSDDIDPVLSREKGYNVPKLTFEKSTPDNNRGGRYPRWEIQPVGEHRQHNLFATKLVHSLTLDPTQHTRESYLDAASTLQHLFENHPSYENARSTLSWGNTTSLIPNSNEHKSRLRDLHLGMQNIIDNDYRHEPFIGDNRDWNEGQELVTKRAEMKHAGVIR